MASRKRKRRRKKRYHTGMYTSIKTGQECNYRSSWELKYLMWLDANDSVKTFAYESIKIPYVSNLKTGKIRHYIPDIFVEFVDGSKMLIEVKPSKRLTQLAVKKKIDAGILWSQAHGATFKVITELELKLLGLL